LLLNSRSKEFPLISYGFFYDANVIETNVFCKEGLDPNQFVRKVSNKTNLHGRFGMEIVCEKGLKLKKFIKKGLL
jgi:hypothetical protein